MQWGKIAPNVADDFVINKKEDDIEVRFIHRKDETADVYFVSNITRNKGNANCIFNINGKQPELWNPVTREMKVLKEFEIINEKVSVNFYFEDSESVFVIFRNTINSKNPSSIIKKTTPKELFQINNPWTVQFDSTWGGPAKFVVFGVLQDWTENTNKGVKYYSGTATNKTNFDFVNLQKSDKNSTLYLDLGKVNHFAKIKINNQELGIVWTAPWRIEIPSKLLKNKNNLLEIEITNVWANRLIGDEQEPEDAEWLPGHLWGGKYLKEFPDWFINNKPRPSKGRYCFTTWNYFTKESPLVKSGLLGPVWIVKE